MVKQAKHPEITVESEGWVDELLANGERIYDRERHVIVIWHRDRPYMAALKVTQDGLYVFLQSLRRTDAKNVAAIKDKNAGGSQEGRVFPSRTRRLPGNPVVLKRRQTETL